MELFKKSVIVGVSVTPEVGLEVAQIDFASKTVLKYGLRPLEYDINRREIADLDIFKEALQDLFVELQIPKGAEIVLNIPSVTFKVKDYPASLDENQISNAIEEDLLEHYIFKNTDPCISATMLPNASIQFKKVAYTAAQKSMIIEIAMMIKELGYKLYAIDTSVNSTLNSLIYKERLDVEPGKSWVLAIVDNCSCRVLLMNGQNYVDSYEDKISIGEVLGDAENYATVINAPPANVEEHSVPVFMYSIQDQCYQCRNSCKQDSIRCTDYPSGSKQLFKRSILKTRAWGRSGACADCFS